MRSLVIAALLLVTALAGCEERAEAPDDDGGQDDPLYHAYWPFRDVVYAPEQNFSLFVQWTGDLPSPVVPFGLEWITDSTRSGFYSGFYEGGARTVGNLTLTEMADPDAPRFGMDGYNATRVDIYVFIDTDERLAHTDSIAFQDLGRSPWVREDEQFQIADEVYYLGEEEEAPHGTEHLPPFLEPYKDQMIELAFGLPVGGAQSIIVPESEAGAAGDFYGDLYITAQVTELVHAP